MEASDRDKFGPPDDTPIMPWYAGAYSQGFVILHPFFTVDGLDPSKCEYGTLVLRGSEAPPELGFVEWTEKEAARRRFGKETDQEGVDGLAKRLGRRITWQTMCETVEIADHCELDRALRTNIHGLRHDLSNTASAERLISYCTEHEIFLPNEGRFEPLIQSSLATLFRQAGLQSIIVGDEFGDDERLIPISLLEGDALWGDMTELPIYGIKRLIAPDRSLFAWVHWDSFYTLILGTAEAFREFEISQLFEGFWCSDETNTYWLTQPCIPLAQ
ncbi:MAG: DUF2711 family protein [Sandarakinorhabdus sp.]|jgi:hypothetical protein|nr:DUF2711 family protein [Sandarakinorhabdus sp.]